MRFSLLCYSQPLGFEPMDRVYGRLARLAGEAEALGLHGLWLAEHHFSRYGACPAPDVLLAFLAARTSRLRLGSAVVVLALDHPLRVAERLALLDQISGGRLDAGFGKGDLWSEFDPFGVEFEERHARFREGLSVVQRLWRGERTLMGGAFHVVRPVKLLPPPRQQPHPPIYVATREVEWAARHGYHLLTTGRLDVVAKTIAAYHAAGSPERSLDACCHRFFCVGESRAHAESRGRAGFAERLRRYLTTYHVAGQPSPVDALIDTEGFDATVQRLMRDHLFGDPAGIRAQVADLREAGVTHLLLTPVHDLEEEFAADFTRSGLEHLRVGEGERLPAAN